MRSVHVSMRVRGFLTFVGLCVTCLFVYFYVHDSTLSEFDWSLLHSFLTSLDLYSAFPVKLVYSLVL